jgi:hypothetical protein
VSVFNQLCSNTCHTDVRDCSKKLLATAAMTVRKCVPHVSWPEDRQPATERDARKASVSAESE